MTILHHLDDATLMSFAAGTLGEALSAVVAAHTELCPDCRRTLRRMEAIGGALLGRIEGSPLTAKSPVTATRGPAPIEGLPRPIAKLLGGPLADLAWKRIAPGVRSVKLPMSENAAGDLRLLKVDPGRTIPEHGHGGAELTLVLSGAYRDSMGRFGPGDVADLDEAVEHMPVIEAGEACICLIASEHQMRFKGLVSRLLQPLVGI